MGREAGRRRADLAQAAEEHLGLGWLLYEDGYIELLW